MSSMASILLLLPKLNQTEIIALEKALSTFKRQGDNVWLEADLYDRFNLKLKSALPPFGIFKKTTGYAKWASGIVSVKQLLVSLKVGTSGVSYLKMLDMLVFSTLTYLDKLEIPVGIKTISQVFERIEQVIDDQFPGYLESGLLYLMIKEQL